MNRSRQQIVVKVRERLKLLQTSVELYDRGSHAEGDRIAGELALLFDDRGANLSLLTMLGLEKINLRSTHDARRTNSLVWNHMFQIELTGLPALVRPKPFVNNSLAWYLVRREEWWDAEVVVSCENLNLTRRQMVSWVRDKDNAHVDSSLPQNYLNLQSFWGFSMKVGENWQGSGTEVGAIIALEDGHRACMRQISYEVLNSPSLRNYLTIG